MYGLSDYNEYETQVFELVKYLLPLFPTTGIKYKIENYTVNINYLRQTIRGMTKAQLEKYVYNGYNRNARNLANWWEDDQASTAKRIKRTKKRKLNKSYGKTQINN